MWYMSENSGPEKPAEIDKTSSKIFNYIRKDFVEIPAPEGEEEMFGSVVGSMHWQYKEEKIPKKNWNQFIRDDIFWYLADQKYEKEHAAK